MIKVKPVTDPAFAQYGRIVDEFDTAELLEEMQKTPAPDSVIYVPSASELESLAIYKEFTKRLYGGMPMQIGYCNGVNHNLNAVEYHRDSEFNLACSDLIMLYGREQDINRKDNTYDTANIEAFLVPKGTMIECYATTLHYAPCSVDGKPFRCVVALPRGTNEPLDRPMGTTGEDRLLTNVNKWLIGHAEGGLDASAYIGLVGENITVN